MILVTDKKNLVNYNFDKDLYLKIIKMALFL